MRTKNSAGSGPASAVATGAILGLTLVDATPNANADLLTLEEGTNVVLANYETSTFGVRMNPTPGVSIGSMRLRLTGPLSHTQTENHLPYSLFGDQIFVNPPSQDVNGRSMPAGSYTLSVTVYSEDDLGGDTLDELEIGFTVAEEDPASDHQTAAPGSSGPPQRLTLALDGSAVVLSWDPPADNGNSAITGYRVEVSRAGTAWAELAHRHHRHHPPGRCGPSGSVAQLPGEGAQLRRNR